MPLESDKSLAGRRGHRNLEFGLGLFAPLVLLGIMGHLLIGHLEKTENEALERQAARNFLSLQWHLDPMPVFSAWVKSLDGALRASSYVRPSDETALPPCPPGLTVQVAAFAPGGVPWTPKGMTAPQRLAVTRVWDDFVSERITERNQPFHRILLGGAIPAFDESYFREDRVFPVRQRGEVRVWLYFTREDDKSGLLAVLKNDRGAWDAVTQACSRVSGPTGWLLRDPSGTREPLFMRGSPAPEPGGRELDPRLLEKRQFFAGPTTLGERWYLCAKTVLPGLEVVQVLPLANHRFAGWQAGAGGALVLLFITGLYAWGFTHWSPLAGLGIVRRWLLLLVITLLLPGGILGFLWVGWFRDGMTAVIDQKYESELAGLYAIDLEYPRWVEGVGEQFKRILRLPAFRDPDKYDVRKAWVALRRKGWRVFFALLDQEARAVAESNATEMFREFFNQMGRVVIQAQFNAEPAPPAERFRAVYHHMFQSPNFGYRNAFQNPDCLTSREVMGNTYYGIWQYVPKSHGSRVAVAFVGQWESTLINKFLTTRLPGGVFAYRAEEGSWIPHPPPFAVDTGLLAEATLAQRPGRVLMASGAATVLVTAAPSRILHGVTLVKTAPLDDVARAGRTLQAVFFGSGLLLLGVALAIWRLLSQALLAPLAEFTRGITALERRQLSFRLSDMGHDEVGLVARAFNEMMAERADLDVAGEVQRHILPRTVPTVPGYQVAFRCLPLVDVGGDYLDVQMRPDGKLLLTIADVTGHGLSAAMVTMMAKTFVTLEARRNTGLRGIVDVANQKIHQLVQRRKILTFAGLLLDPATHALEWTTAGHPAPLLFGVADAVRELKIIQGPIGYNPRFKARTEFMALAPGESILLFTDGLVETLNPRGDVFGYDRLIAFAQDHRGLSPDALLDELLAFRARFADGTPLEDDLTLLALHRVRDGL